MEKETIEKVKLMYLGCEVEVKLHGKNYKGILRGLNSDYLFVHLEGDHYETKQLRAYVKPILRSLDSMTKEEAYHIAELGTRVAGRKNLILESLDVNSLQVHILISYTINGQTVGDGKYKEQIIISQNSAIYSRNFHHWDEKIVPTEGFQITLYLLSKGFDLWNLIESNQAIKKP